MSSVIYTGAFRFPEGDAAAARVLGIGKALRESGLKVVFAGWEEHERREDLQEDGTHSYQGFPYVSQADLRFKELGLGGRLTRYVLSGGNTLRWLRAINCKEVKAIIAYHGTSTFLHRLNIICRRNGIKLILDCTEWYDARALPGGRFGIVGLDNLIRMRLVNWRIGRIIAISSYLERYYAERGCGVLRIPPLVDLRESKWPAVRERQHENDILHLVYAGSPGQKDLIANAVKGLAILRKKRLPVVLHFIGPSKAEVYKLTAGDAGLRREVDAAVICHGRVSQSSVPKLLSDFDFSILLRPRKRYAEAGFPTKLVESISAGVPVIVNQTSDIGEYIRDGKEGILLPNYTIEAFVAGVTRLFGTERSEWFQMRRMARSRAATSFDFRNYVDRIRTFLRA
jgi:glycosyltransferase involved in cell wall biosynthesis